MTLTTEIGADIPPPATKLQRIEQGVKITGEKRAELAQDVKTRYEKGSSIRELGFEMGRSYGFVHRLLEEAGVQFRHRGGQVRRGSTTAGSQ